MLHIAIVEDNTTASRLLKDYLESEELKVTAIYNSGEEALATIPTLPLPDVILMDIGLPNISGIEVTRRLKESYPQLEIVMQTVFEDCGNIMEAIKAGASGYLLKASSREEIISALLEVKKGGSFLTGKVARKVLREFQDQGAGEISAGADSKAAPAGRFGLSDREEEILKGLINGDSYKKIADDLCISVHTVNNHIRKIYEKMQVNSRGEAVAKAINP
ncbi:MAG: response regulator transcription factor [Nitrospirota bacterium]|nr:response regulator transcription factor [Nitrospirota bacterium]